MPRPLALPFNWSGQGRRGRVRAWLHSIQTLPHLLLDRGKDCLYLKYVSMPKSLQWQQFTVNLQSWHNITVTLWQFCYHRAVSKFCYHRAVSTHQACSKLLAARSKLVPIMDKTWTRNKSMYSLNTQNKTFNLKRTPIYTTTHLGSALWVQWAMSNWPLIMKSYLLYQHRTNILYLVEKYQTVIIVGETGCGKSTQVPADGVKYGDCMKIWLTNVENYIAFFHF